MIDYIIFTQEELQDMRDGKMVSTPNNDGHLTVYASEESYSKMMQNMKNKEFPDD